MREQPHVFGYAGRPLTGFDGNGVWWSVNAADGWHAAPGLRSSSESRAGQDGEWASPPKRGARIVRFQGKMREAPSLTALEQSIREFASLPVSGEAVGESPWGVLAGQAQLEDAPQVEMLSPSVAVWQFAVKLTDPLLYGPPVQVSAGLAGVVGTGRVWPRVWPRDWGVPAGVTPGSVSVPNAGTAAYWPTARIDGPVINPRVTLNETGDWVRVARTVAAGQWLEVDFANRRVLLNGIPTLSMASVTTFSGRWLAVPVGGGSISWAADSADPAALLTINGFEGAYL